MVWKFFSPVDNLPVKMTSTHIHVACLISLYLSIVDDPCENNECSHVCLLSEASLQGFTCACPLGYLLDNDTFCKG